MTFRDILKLIDTSRSAFTYDIPEDGDLTDGLRDTWTSQDGDSHGAAEFLTVRSSFYPGLSDYYEKKAELWLEKWLRDNREDDEDEEEDVENESESVEVGQP